MSNDKTIVIVDDEPFIVDMLSTFLEIKGYQVHGAYSGEDGLATVQVEKPDAVLLDLMLPDIDGLEVMSRLRAMPDFADLPIIIVSARTDTESKVRAEQGGANDYMTKPVQMPVLADLLSRLLSARQPAVPPVAGELPAVLDGSFWDYIDRLVTENRLVIDRPKGSAHPRFPEVIYPVDYGYLEGTSAMDGAGIDVWVGTTGTKRADAVFCTVDLLKRDAEIKIVLGCTQTEKQTIMKFLNQQSMRGLLILRDEVK
ncbi:MAG: response regulator [Chloroflexi bacterium]|nr:response regulator [Chloroflexota bacterium]